MHTAASGWRKPTAIGLVALLHLVMFYAFTHGMTIPAVFELATPIKLVSVPPAEITPPKPPEMPASIKDQRFDQSVPIRAELPVFQTEVVPIQVIPDGPVGDAADQLAGGSGPVVEEAPHALVIAHRVDPAYPASARRAGEQGTVLLSVRVDPSGAVSAVTVVRSSGSIRLDDAARDAVKRWRFAARKTYQAGTVEVKLPISFKLESTRF